MPIKIRDLFGLPKKKQKEIIDKVKTKPDITQDKIMKIFKLD